ncbi:MAG: phosphatase PAP2 family protein [Solirubrobacterales bacterium]|nr:phosphatase PAP2 family protein [Solirubrobacterales bacterium]
MPADPSSAPPRDSGARTTLRFLLRGGPFARAVARTDLAVYRAIRRTARPPQVVAVVSRFSSLGEHAGLWLAVGAVGTAVDEPRRAQWRRAAIGVGCAYLANFGLKNVFRRKRPVFEDLPQLIKTPTALSFPSAHATSSFAAARAYAPLLPTGPLYAVAGTMALSRVYLGVHYPTDIVAGATFGTIMGSLAR